MNTAELIKIMDKCEQTKGQSVLTHGSDVWSKTSDLRDILLDIEPEWKAVEPEKDVDQWRAESFRLPAWFMTHKTQLAEALHDEDVLLSYTLYHDCGKPFCREVDEDGRVHFPDHANVSKRTYQEVHMFQRMVVGNLIGWDMVLHTATAEEIEVYLKHEWATADAVSLLVVALAEVHSNARLFGGIESVSFKSKWKQLDRRGKQICKHLFGGDR